MRRIVIAMVVLVAAALAGVAAAAGLRSKASTWIWRQGDASVYVGALQGSNTLVLHSPSDINLRGSHVRMGSDDGNFILAHSSRTPAQLNAYYIGTATRTPIQIGADSNSTTALVVAGTAGQKADLQQWTLSGQTVAAIDGQGRLRLGSVTLDPELVNGRVQLYAITDTGKQLLATGVPQP